MILRTQNQKALFPYMRKNPWAYKTAGALQDLLRYLGQRKIPAKASFFKYCMRKFNFPVDDDTLFLVLTTIADERTALDIASYMIDSKAGASISDETLYFILARPTCLPTEAIAFIGQIVSYDWLLEHGQTALQSIFLGANRAPHTPDILARMATRARQFMDLYEARTCEKTPIVTAHCILLIRLACNRRIRPSSDVSTTSGNAFAAFLGYLKTNGRIPSFAWTEAQTCIARSVAALDETVDRVE